MSATHTLPDGCPCDLCADVVAHLIARELATLRTIAPERRADVLAAALATVPADIRTVVRP